MDVTALLIAIVGILGTLASALLTQRNATRLKMLEIQSAERQRVANYEIAAEQEAEKLRRSCFVAVNYALRNYYSTLQNHRRTLASRSPREGELARLEEIREASRAALAEAQMVAPEDILSIARDSASLLFDAYQTLACVDRDIKKDAHSRLEKADQILNAASLSLSTLRASMRKNLGVD
ncbi:hypothetical protein FHU36_002035 [Nonomuraea muscovyensis]|uniref:Uncharacterized protein n=1 Tax=Nonomuraea muscovyensis TaxID=1124761 RepID=A0A7X0C0L4_9ACTN|nr:hypothetical protein [Nonomuraea muscovyensis]MBB6345526.1 hypothetical protein [Nonomuraea muscovyensis]